MRTDQRTRRLEVGNPRDRAVSIALLVLLVVGLAEALASRGALVAVGAALAAAGVAAGTPLRGLTAARNRIARTAAVCSAFVWTAGFGLDALLGRQTAGLLCSATAALALTIALIGVRPPRAAIARHRPDELLLELVIVIAVAVLAGWMLLPAGGIEGLTSLSGIARLSVVGSAVTSVLVLGLLALRRPAAGSASFAFHSLGVVALVHFIDVGVAVREDGARLVYSAAVAASWAAWAAALRSERRRARALPAGLARSAPRADVTVFRAGVALLIVLLTASGVAGLAAGDRIALAGCLTIALLVVLRMTLAVERDGDGSHSASRGFDRIVSGSDFAAELSRAGSWEGSRTRGVALIRLEHMDDVRDSWGRRAEEHLARRVAGVVRRQSRSNDLVSWSNAAELAVLMDDLDANGAARFGARVQTEVARLRFVADRDGMVPVTVTIGIGVVDAGRADEALALADQALEAARRSHRQPVRVLERRGGESNAVVRLVPISRATG